MPRASSKTPAKPLFAGYAPVEGCFDEVFRAEGSARGEARRVVGLLDRLGTAEFNRRPKLADLAFR